MTTVPSPRGGETSEPPVPSRRVVAVSVALATAVASTLSLWGIRTGLPSRERLDLSLGGPMAVDAARPRIEAVLASRATDRSEFVEKRDKEELARLSPYFDQIRSFHPDEQYVLKVVGRMARDRDLHPRSYIYGPFFFYQIAAGLAVGRALGQVSGGTGVLDYLRAPESFAPAYLWGRLACAVLGLASVLLTYAIGVRVGGAACGVVAALLLAALPLQVLASKFIKPDTPVQVWTAAAILAAIPIGRTARVRDYVLAGVFVGLAAGSKYPGALAGAFVAAFHVARRGLDRPRGEDLLLLVAGVSAVAAFVATNPACVLDARVFWKDWGWISDQLRGGSVLTNLWDALVCYGQDAFVHFMGPAATLAIAGGTVAALTRWRLPWTPLAIGVAVFFLFASRGRPGSDAYFLPAYPALAVLGARALLALPWRRVTVPIAILATLSWGWAYAETAARENARVIAARWIVEHVPPGATLGMAQYPVGYRVPMVNPSTYRLLSVDLDADAEFADWWIDSSFEWRPASWRDRIAGRVVTNPPPSADYRVEAVIESVPRALFGLLPLTRDHMLSPYHEVVAPRIVIYRRVPK